MKLTCLRCSSIILGLIALLNVVQAQEAKLAIVIDDFGYRLRHELQIIALSPNITVSILPNAPYTQRVAEAAEKNGNEVMLHLPMLPLSQQPLEKETLTPTMTESQIKSIIDRALMKVPVAVGINNHMGSAMTSNYAAMLKVMASISAYPLFFLDSKTVANSQVTHAANQFRTQVLTRDIFLDDTIDAAVIRSQFNKALNVARRKGYAIAIGHPHPQTLQVLTSVLKTLPSDVKLVKMTQLVKLQAAKSAARLARDQENKIDSED